MPSSRPKPDCLKPPNGVETRTELFELTERTPGLERARHAQRAGAVARPDRAGEAVGRVVREPDRLGLVLERDQRGNRAEDLLARDAVVVGRLDERAREPEAGAVRGLALEERRRPRRTRRPVSRCAAEIERPHLRRLVGRVADLDAARRLDEQLEEAVVDRLARRGCASARSSPGRRCRRRRTARRRRPSRGRRRRRSTFADLPPSSSVTRLIVAGGACASPCWPTSVEPVKPILATSGCSISRCPTTEPLPTRTLTHALGDARPRARARRGAAPRAASARPA